MTKGQQDAGTGLQSATVAVYSLKGGVGKTTFAVNLAWASARVSRRRTLLWDLDPQAASTWLLTEGTSATSDAQSVFSKSVDARSLCQPSRFEGIDVLAADTSLRGLDRMLFDIGKKKRLARLIDGLSSDYDRIILDCPPGLTETAEQVLQAADLVIVPVIPSPLSQRALGEVARFLVQKGGRHPPILPVFSMVDRRRSLHGKAMQDQPDWPVIAMASAIEQMTVKRAPLGEFAPSSPAAGSYASLWTAIERRLQK
ncbi:MAG TPA: ParA family protein [Sphingobium sp.]